MLICNNIYKSQDQILININVFIQIILVSKHPIIIAQCLFQFLAKRPLQFINWLKNLDESHFYNRDQVLTKMNPKIFAKAFNDIKKQAEQQQSKSIRKVNNVQPEAQSSQVNIKDKLQPLQKKQVVIDGEGDGEDQKPTKAQVFNKKIAKQYYAKNEAIIKKWKEQFYKKEAARKARLILIQNSNSKEILKVIKNYKIDIQQIHDDRILMSTQGKANECLELLHKSGISAKKSGQIKEEKPQTREEKEPEKKGTIFSRIQ